MAMLLRSVRSVLTLARPTTLAMVAPLRLPMLVPSLCTPTRGFASMSAAAAPKPKAKRASVKKPKASSGVKKASVKKTSKKASAPKRAVGAPGKGKARRTPEQIARDDAVLKEQRERRKAKQAESRARKEKLADVRKEKNAAKRLLKVKRTARLKVEEKDRRARARARASVRRDRLRDEARAKEQKRKLRVKANSRKKDPNSPKRPRSAFAFYYKEALANRGAQKITEFLKTSATTFKTLAADTKAKYEASAAADSARYKTEQAAWEAKQPQKIKRKLGPFMLFAVERRPAILAANPSLKVAAVGKALGAAWRALSDAEREKYGYVKKVKAPSTRTKKKKATA